MDHIIASAGLRLSYRCDPKSIGKLDAEEILEDLSEPTTRHALCGWFAQISLTDFDHVVVATDRETGRHVAMMIANDGETCTGSSYLELRAAIVIEPMSGTKLMRQLLAYTVSRVSCLRTMPTAIAVRTSLPACYQLLSLFSTDIPDAAIFPEPEPAPIHLWRAALARQVAQSAAPHLQYEAGTAAIKGGRRMNATCFATTTRPAPHIDAMFERRLGSSDAMMVIVDMRDCNQKTFDAETRALIRSRWKVPLFASRDIAASTSSRFNGRNDADIVTRLQVSGADLTTRSSRRRAAPTSTPSAGFSRMPSPRD